MSDNLKNLQARIDGNAAQPTGMVVWKTAMVKVTVGELKEAIANHPSCPQAEAFKKAVEGMGDDYIVNVCKVDLECLLKKAATKDTKSIDPATGATVITRDVTNAKPPAKPKD